MNSLHDLGRLLAAMTPLGVGVELAVLAACLGAAFLFIRHLRGEDRPASSMLFGDRIYDGLLFPLIALLLSLIARWLLRKWFPIALLELAAPVLFSLLLIRLCVRAMRLGFPRSQIVHRFERTASWLIWFGLVLWFTGALSWLAHELEQMHWRVGGVDVSVLTLVQAGFSGLLVLLIALWLSTAVEAMLLKRATARDMSARKMAANALRAVLLFVGLLLALSAAGIPLSALSVMGGALGVGIGLGLQRIAANYVSGFVILAEEALRIGDTVKVDGFEGRITDIKARYTVIRAPSGRESIVPNEMLIAQRVENASLADGKVQLSTKLRVVYGTALDALLPALAGVVRDVPRVLAAPAPDVHLSAFADDGFELTVSFCIGDPHNGQANAVSAVNLALLGALHSTGVEFAFPQRIVHLQRGQPGGDVPPA